MDWTSLTLQGLTFSEPALNLLALVVALRVGLGRRFPAMITYLSLRLFSCVALLLTLNADRFMAVSERTQTMVYFYGYWSSYILCTIAIFFVVQEVFHELMRPVPDLSRLGMVAFRWVSIASVLITLGAVALPALNGGLKLPFIAVELMRCISIMELCLLLFLALTVRSLGHSFRSQLFGIGLGFGVQAVWEMILPVLMLLKHHPIYSTENLILQAATTVTFLIWTGYFLAPQAEMVTSAETLPVSSPLIRWNEIAKALGHNTPHVAVGQSQAFFLQDVEGVVDKVLTKNSISVNN
jgi:hypothetical protein